MKRSCYRSFCSLLVLWILTLRVLAADPPPLQPISPIADEPFLQEYREPFVAWEQPLGEAPVAVTLDGSGVLWAAGPWGVRRLNDGQWQAPGGVELDGPAFAFAADGEAVWVAAWDGLYRIEDGKLDRAALEGEPLGLVRLTDGRLFAGGPGGLWERTSDGWKEVTGHFSRSGFSLSRWQPAIGDEVEFRIEAEFQQPI